MRISDWSSDVCSSDLCVSVLRGNGTARRPRGHRGRRAQAGQPPQAYPPRRHPPHHREGIGFRMTHDDRHKTHAHMGIEIDVNKITAVLLPYGNLYDVEQAPDQVATGIHFLAYT